MNVENPKTCEECLGLLTGIEIPKTPRSKITDYGFVVEKNDATILFSIAKQLSKGIALTDRQYKLVKNKLIEYKDQFDKKGIDVISVSDNLLYELREIDRSHWIKVLRWKDEDILGIRFPFNKKVINRIEELRKLNSVQDLSYKDNTHYFPYTARNIYCLVEIAQRFENKFTIQDHIMEIYKQLKDYEHNKKDYVPGVYNLEIRNIPQTAIEILEKDLGKVDANNLHLYFDRRSLFGLHHFDKDAVNENLNKETLLTKEIIKRKGSAVLIKNTQFSFNEIISSLLDIKRFPILIILDEKKANDDLVETYKSIRNVIADQDISVMFRLDGTEPFNEFVRDNNLNNLVAKNTKVVYINSTKLPKPLMASKWVPNAVINYRSKGLGYNKVTEYSQQFDLQIVYEDPNNIGYWNRREKSFISGNL